MFLHPSRRTTVNPAGKVSPLRTSEGKILSTSWHIVCKEQHSRRERPF